VFGHLQREKTPQCLSRSSHTERKTVSSKTTKKEDESKRYSAVEETLKDFLAEQFNGLGTRGEGLKYAMIVGKLL